jgi:hypothetical protein
MKLFNDDLERIKDLPGRGRITIESYRDAMNRFELKRERKYRFVANPFKE